MEGLAWKKGTGQASGARGDPIARLAWGRTSRLDKWEDKLSDLSWHVCHRPGVCKWLWLLVSRSLACVCGGLMQESHAARPRQLGYERVAGAGVVAAGGLGQSSWRRDWKASMLVGS